MWGCCPWAAQLCACPALYLPCLLLHLIFCYSTQHGLRTHGLNPRAEADACVARCGWPAAPSARCPEPRWRAAPKGSQYRDAAVVSLCAAAQTCETRGTSPQLTLPVSCLHLEEQLWFSFLVSDGKGVTSVNKPQKS